jgi:16S rRNA (guanine(966)-N(2))-methyltransferase RsmD
VRVIAGKYKGRKLIGPKDNDFRPTLDRVKESIFNVLGGDLIDSIALDLFCGTGALGIEAISRGAMRATFVDNDKSILNIAQKNAVNLGIEKKTKYFDSDVFDFMKNLADFSADIVFADPPYDNAYGSEIIRGIAENNMLHPGGILVLERFKKDIPQAEGFKLAKTLKFGQTEVDFYIREE